MGSCACKNNFRFTKEKTATEEVGEDGSKETKNRNIYKGNGLSGYRTSGTQMTSDGFNNFQYSRPRTLNRTKAG